MKKTCCMLIIALMISVLSPIAVFANEIQITVDGQPINGMAVMQNDRIYVCSNTAANLGVLVSDIDTFTDKMDGETLTIIYQGQVISVSPDRAVAKVSSSDGEQELDMHSAPIITDGTLLLPARFLSELTGSDVAWNGEEKTISFVTHPDVILKIGETEITENLYFLTSFLVYFVPPFAEFLIDDDNASLLLSTNTSSIIQNFMKLVDTNRNIEKETNDFFLALETIYQQNADSENLGLFSDMLQEFQLPLTPSEQVLATNYLFTLLDYVTNNLENWEITEEQYQEFLKTNSFWELIERDYDAFYSIDTEADDRFLETIKEVESKINQGQLPREVLLEYDDFKPTNYFIRTDWLDNMAPSFRWIPEGKNSGFLPPQEYWWDVYFAKHLPSPKLEDLTTKQKDEIISQCEWDIIKEIFKTLPKEGDLEVVNQPSYAHIFDFSLSEVLKSLEEIEDTEPAIP